MINTNESPQRSRTPADLKWLLNERAALAGKVAALSADLHGLTKTVATLEATLKQHQTTIAALDQVIGLGYPQAAPDAAGAVRAWAGKYGERGNLRSFLRERLKEVFPQSLTSVELTDMVCKQFSIVWLTSEQRIRQKKMVRRALTTLKMRGEVVPLHDIKSTKLGRWAWAGDKSLSFAEALALQQASYEHHNGPDSAPAHPIGNQVAGQRTLGNQRPA